MAALRSGSQTTSKIISRALLKILICHQKYIKCVSLKYCLEGFILICSFSLFGKCFYWGAHLNTGTCPCIALLSIKSFFCAKYHEHAPHVNKCFTYGYDFPIFFICYMFFA